LSSIKHSAAANDEIHGSGAERPGEIVLGLLKHRVRPSRDVLAETEQYLARPRLDSALSEALGPRDILHLEAPSGFGKSVAMAAAATRGRDGNSVRRIVLSERENDPARLLALLQFVFGKDETPDWPAGPGCLADQLSLLLEESPWQSSEQAGVLVLDNLEEITGSGSLALIQQLAEELPAAMALGLCSRGVVRLETHRLELQNRYRRFGAQTLALSREEVRGFFEPQLRQNRMTSVAVENLYSLTEGWLTPLALYRRQIAQSATPRGKIQETAAVQRFIRDTVLGNCTPSRIGALRVMAEMDEISDELHLALVSPDEKAPGWLPSAASEAGIPLFALPSAGSWYRFNPLVPAVLSQTVLEGREHRYLNASRWYYHHGRFAEALRYALLSGNTEEVLSITSRDSEALLLGQDTGPLLDLRRKLPQWLIGKSARIRIVYAWVHSIGGQYSQAERLIGGLEPDTGLMASRLSALRAFILRGRGYTHAAIDEADRALASDELSTQAKLVSRLVKSSALCAAGRYSEARESNRVASRLAREAGDTGAEALAVYDHARIELGKGGLYHARQLLQTALDTALQEFNGPVRVGVTRLRLDLALILWHQGQVEQADQLLIDCIRETEQSRDLGLLLALVLRSVLARDQRRLEDAFTWIGQAERIMQAWQVDEDVYRPVMEALKASCWLAKGQKESAWQALVRLRDFRDRQLSPELFPMLQRLIDFQEVRILLAAGDLDGAARCLNDLRRFRRVSLPMRVHMALLEALLAWHRKAPQAKTRELLSAAIEEAASEHFVSPFADMISDLSEPMQKILPTLAITDFTRHLASLFGIRLSRPETPQLAEPISDREFAVLELIAGGLSNQAIADQLHISLHTVKTHARRINAKLEVKSRTQAIVRARELGLLQG
jgi:LuxR family maltose regulon positive regulatory protein